MKSTSSSGQPGSSAGLTLEGREWRLSDHIGPGGSLVPVAEEVIATATFIEGRVAGTTGCNQFSGGYRVEGSSLSFGALAMTRMACIPPRDNVERAMTAALESTAGCAVIEDALELTDAEGNTVLRFRAAAAPRLVGTTWVATGINNGRGGVVSSVTLEAAHVTATFADDGRITGFGGCNGFGGSYTLDGGSIHIGPVTATRKACVERAELRQPGTMERTFGAMQGPGLGGIFLSTIAGAFVGTAIADAFFDNDSASDTAMTDSGSSDADGDGGGGFDGGDIGGGDFGGDFGGGDFG